MESFERELCLPLHLELLLHHLLLNMVPARETSPSSSSSELCQDPQRRGSGFQARHFTENGLQEIFLRPDHKFPADIVQQVDTGAGPS